MGDLSRRGFLSAMMAATASAAALALDDPERLLWEPGQKTIVDLGAKVAPATLPEIAGITAYGPSRLAQALGDGRMAPFAPLRPLYMPDRYRIDLADGTSMGFDSNWQMQSGYRHGQPMSDREKARMAAEIARTRTLKINPRTFRLED